MSDKKPKNIFVDGPISPVKIGEDIAHHQKKTNIGAHSIFLGQVRADSVEGAAVLAIDFIFPVSISIIEISLYTLSFTSGDFP